jgi:hypothetical protein
MRQPALQRLLVNGKRQMHWLCCSVRPGSYDVAERMGELFVTARPSAAEHRRLHSGGDSPQGAECSN